MGRGLHQFGVRFWSDSGPNYDQIPGRKSVRFRAGNWFDFGPEFDQILDQNLIRFWTEFRSDSELKWMLDPDSVVVHGEGSQLDAKKLQLLFQRIDSDSSKTISWEDFLLFPVKYR